MRWMPLLEPVSEPLKAEHHIVASGLESLLQLPPESHVNALVHEYSPGSQSIRSKTFGSTVWWRICWWRVGLLCKFCWYIVRCKLACWLCCRFSWWNKLFWVSPGIDELLELCIWPWIVPDEVPPSLWVYSSPTTSSDPWTSKILGVELMGFSLRSHWFFLGMMMR